MADLDFTKLKEGFQYEWSRNWVAAGLTVTVFLAVLALGIANPASIRTVMTDQNSVTTAFQSLSLALITSVTLAVTITQLAVSRELGPLKDQRENMEGALDFRRTSEKLFEGISPSKPSEFLRIFVQSLEDRARKLNDQVSDQENDNLRNEVEEFTENTIRNTEDLDERLGTLEFGHFEVVNAALSLNYNSKLYNVRRIQHKFKDSLQPEEDELLEDIQELLELYGPAREHFKTIYFRSDLLDLTHTMIYTAIPSLIISLATVLFLNTEPFQTSFLGVDLMLIMVSASATLTLVPFLVLISYILRIGTVAQRTLAIGPFIIQESEEI